MDKTQADVFPGPWWPALAQTILLYSRAWWIGGESLRHKYGEVFRLRLVNPGPKSAKTGLVVADPEEMRSVLTGSPQIYEAGKSHALRPIWGKHSVLSVDGEAHARLRRLLMPSFSGAALRGYATMFETLAEADAKNWPLDTPTTALENTQRITLEIILRTVFGVSDEERSAVLRPLTARIGTLGVGEILWLTVPTLKKFRVGLEYRQALIRLREIMDREIVQRRTDPDLHGRADVLSRMLAVDMDGDRLTDAEVRDQLVSLVTVGQESTAKALAWCLLHLAYNPDVQRKAQAAADAGDLGYLTAVFKESLRLHAVVAFAARRVAEPVKVAGREVPAGTVVLPFLSAPHRDGRYFPEPTEFRPERFLGESDDQLRKWQPFGGGVRRCLGAGFSLAESPIILRSVLTRYDIAPSRPVMEGPSRLPNIVVGPRYGGQIRLTERPSTASDLEVG
ncbi:cytochrome P450 [Antrihabitans cavernicola]|uniref:Cytochrome P450 n=1 Tax=Antrihabitans cavernicola TaxID=2495913 RepID=A0A5A7SDC6_9NOCA|nr:cytochrome P450 [Spelaeibacter cavernicola]KAA0024158.1 cytochrome P450 [Spelaeibacter cavernicola]